MPLREAIARGQEAFLLVINNKYFETYSMLDKYAKDSFYHAVGKGLILCLRFAFTLKVEYYTDAWASIQYAVRKIEKCRRQSNGTVAKLFSKNSSYNDWTDIECHAELCFAEISAVHTMLMVVNDRSIRGLIKAAIKIRTCYQSYKECKNILKYRKSWEDPDMKPHFESGVLLGLGLFDMGISYFPSRLVYLLEIAGFSGSRINGLELLMACSRIKDGIRYPAVSVALSGYFGFGEFFYGLGEPNVNCIYEILHHWEPKAPNSIAVIMGRAFKASWEGNFDEAVTFYDEYSRSQTLIKALHYFSNWQKMWIHSCQWDWKRAAENAESLMTNCPWSPSMFHYIYACILSMVAEDERGLVREEMMNKVQTHFRLAVKLKRSFGGKRAFHEKLVAEKAKTFILNPDKIVLATLDLMYLWNVFPLGARNPDTLPTILGHIEERLETWTKDKSIEIYAYLTFMKGVVLKYSNLPLTAVNCFFELMNYEKQLKEENHIIPQSCFEVGGIYRNLGDFTEAKKWFKKTNSYTNYKTDGLIRFRIDAAVKLMKQT